MPDPTDPIFLPRININRSGCDCDSDSPWPGLESCPPSPGSPLSPGWRLETSDNKTANCDKSKCSAYSSCDSKPDIIKHNYYDCCVKVSASKLLDHWLNDHRDTSTACQAAAQLSSSTASQLSPCPTSLQHCQNPETEFSSLLSSLQTKPDETILHVILRQHRTNHVRNIVELVKYVVDTRRIDEDNNIIIDTPDNHGDTPLTLVRHILDQGDFQHAKSVAELLIEAGADANHSNECGWSLLSYSLVHQDSSLSLTRSLLHHGSAVIPNRDALTADQPSSPLRVLLRSILRSQSLENARESLHILGQVLSCQEPIKMKDHVLSSIVAEASLLTGNGPELCSEIQAILSAYWTQPKPLLHISLQASRKRLGLKRLNSGNLKAMIAPRIHHYLSYQSTLPLFCSAQTTGTNKTDKYLSNHTQDVLSDKIRIRLQQRKALKK